MNKSKSEWKKRNSEKVKEQKKRYRQRHRSDKDKKINLIRVHSYRRIKPLLILKYGGCQLCKSKEKLEIHHVRYTTNVEDIFLLCRKCHLNIHSGDNHDKNDYKGGAK